MSYSRADREFAAGLASHLEGAGLVVRWEFPGDGFSREVQRALDECAAVVAVVSEAGAGSQRLERELRYAGSRRKPVFALLRGAAGAPPGVVRAESVGAGLPTPTFVEALRRQSADPGAPAPRRATGRARPSAGAPPATPPSPTPPSPTPPPPGAATAGTPFARVRTNWSQSLFFRGPTPPSIPPLPVPNSSHGGGNPRRQVRIWHSVMAITTATLPPIGIYAALFTLWTLRQSRNLPGRTARRRAAILKTQRVVTRYVLAGTLWSAALAATSRADVPPGGLLPFDLWATLTAQKPGVGWAQLTLLYFGGVLAITVAIYLYGSTGRGSAARPMNAWMLAITLATAASAAFFGYFWPSFDPLTASILVAVHVGIILLQLVIWIPERRAALGT
ncbi:toll/interleukin-1 receptor domain-containing protein [Cryptosporangium sp. NPDC051539]|uniref:toll/interleukin-1 receptor domain-containing protein n=1 Tax=Cryptosporangium sp. NPDC051539 TaxID=3363962 RepID=UPI0037B9F55E